MYAYPDVNVGCIPSWHNGFKLNHAILIRVLNTSEPCQIICCETFCPAAAASAELLSAAEVTPPMPPALSTAAT